MSDHVYAMILIYVVGVITGAFVMHVYTLGR